MLNRIEHLGIAIKSLETSDHLFAKLLGKTPYKQEAVEREGVKTSFFMVGESKIELLEATNPESPIAKFIDKKGEGIHHIAFATPSVQTCLDELKAKGIRLIDQAPRPGAEGLNIAFLHPKSTLGVLTEICEKPNKK